MHNATIFFIIRSGFIGVKYKVCALLKTQRVGLSQTLLQRWSGLSVLEINLASGVLTLPMIPKHTCLDILDSALYNAESTQQHWM